MVQYIDKADLVAEIERRRKQIPKDETDKTLKTVYGNVAFVLTELLSFLDTLEAKEVDLEKEIHKFIDKGELHLRLWDVDRIAKHFFELGLKAQKGE